MKTILLKFAAPLQSWGTRARFETRHTDFYPSKSAVIGLIAAAIGYRRHEDAGIQKLSELDFAVRVDQQGLLSRDYHTATKYKADGRIDRNYVTNRYFLEDAVFVVAIGHENEEWVGGIASALQNPYFQPFLGRRSFPVTADFFIQIFDGGAMEALKSLPWQAHENEQRQQKATSFVSLPVYADSDLLTDRPRQLRQDSVVSFSQKERRFSFRSESRIDVEIPIGSNQEELDFFEAIGGSNNVYFTSRD